MARPKALKPSYCRNGDRGYVTLNDHRVYCKGAYGSQESRDDYDRIIGEWIASGRLVVPGKKDQLDDGFTISTVLAAFWKYAQEYYVDGDGVPSGEAATYRYAMRPLRKLFGTMPASQFSRKTMVAVRDEMMRMGWCRNVINRQLARIRHIFQWAAENELVPDSAYHAALVVKGIPKKKLGVRESAKVRVVSQDRIDATLDHLPDVVADMVRVQLLTGARPGELCIMRGIDIATTENVWIYRPSRHKTEHHGVDREILIGPKAQAIIEKYLKPDTTAYLFSPSASEQQRLVERHEARETPVTPSQQTRATRSRQKARKRAPQDRYTPASYRRAITRACEKAFGMPAELRNPIPGSARAKAETPKMREERKGAAAAWRAEWVWHPNQLRHNAATNFRREYGAEAAKLMLGDKTNALVDVYAELDRAKLAGMMAKLG